MNPVTIGYADTDRRHSDGVWKNFPTLDVLTGTRDGIYVKNDFTNWRYSTNINAAVAHWVDGWEVFGSDGGVMTDALEVGGAATIGSDGDNEGVSIGLAAKPFKLSRSNKLLCFECRLKTSTITDTKHGIFLGLIDPAALSATVPIAAAGTLADENFVGFHRLEGDGDAFDTVYKADGVTQVTVAEDAVTIAAATYVKLGMRYEQTGDRDGSFIVSFWANGTRLAASKQVPSADGTDFPNDVLLSPVLAVLNATASTPGTTTVDWIEVGQLF